MVMCLTHNSLMDYANAHNTKIKNTELDESD